jgi:hypothetical protein
MMEKYKLWIYKIIFSLVVLAGVAGFIWLYFKYKAPPSVYDVIRVDNQNAYKSSNTSVVVTDGIVQMLADLNFTVDVDDENKLIRLTPPKIDAGTAPVIVKDDSIERVAELDLYGMWASLNAEEDGVGYQFQTSDEFGPYTVIGLREKGDKVRMGFYFVDESNTLYLDYKIEIDATKEDSEPALLTDALETYNIQLTNGSVILSTDNSSITLMRAALTSTELEEGDDADNVSENSE